MKKFIILSIIICDAIFADVLPYKPYPIIFIHGYTSGSGTWGASTKDPIHDRKEEICKDSVLAHPEATYSHFLNYMLPMVEVWHEYEVSHGLSWTYTISTMDNFPNKTFLEVINFDEACGSVDEGGEGLPPPYHNQIGWGKELWIRIKEVLEEYYGDGDPNTTDEWDNNPEAKVILIGHSTGDILNCKLKNERI